MFTRPAPNTCYACTQSAPYNSLYHRTTRKLHCQIAKKPFSPAIAVKRQSIGAYGGANVSQTAAKSRSKRRQTLSANRRLRANVSQTTAKSLLKTVVKAVSRQISVKWQSISAYGRANVSQTTAKSRCQTPFGADCQTATYGGECRVFAKSRSRRHSAVSRQSNGTQSALTGVQMSVRWQRNPLKTLKSFTAVNPLCCKRVRR